MVLNGLGDLLPPLIGRQGLVEVDLGMVRVLYAAVLVSARNILLQKNNYENRSWMIALEGWGSQRISTAIGARRSSQKMVFTITYSLTMRWMWQQ